MANLPITVLLFRFFFGIKAILFLGFAILIAIITGIFYQFLDERGLIECKYHRRKLIEFSLIKDLKRRVKNYDFKLKSFFKDLNEMLNASFQLTKIILWWILIGIFLTSVVSAYILQNIFKFYLGKNFIGLLLTIGLATVLEIFLREQHLLLLKFSDKLERLEMLLHF